MAHRVTVMNNLLHKNSKDIVSFLLKRFNVEKFWYRAYISKIEDKFDEEIEASDLSDLENIYKQYKNKDPRYLISFQSKVLVNGEFRHFPMIDFSNSIVKDINLEKVRSVLRHLGEKEGFILNSGRCFHYYGNKLITSDKWITFTEDCKKYPEIGENYPNRQLGRGKSSLRLVVNERKPKNPEVIEIYRI